MAEPTRSKRATSIALGCAIALAGFARSPRVVLAATATSSAARASRDGDAGALGSGIAVAFEEQSLPSEDLASPAPSPAASSAPSTGSQSPGGADGAVAAAAAGAAPAAAGWTRLPAATSAAGTSVAGTSGAPAADAPTPEASPTEAPPPYDVGSIQPSTPVSDQPLTALIDSTRDQPALNASLRFTEDGRTALDTSKLDNAIRDLGRAVSIDPTDPYAYFYLGRAYMMKKDYSQALAFFGRSEVGVSAVPAWLGEVKSFEGACLEEQGKFGEAAAAYKQALDAAPSNLMARAGYGRLSQSLSDANAGNAAPPPPPIDGAALPAPTVNLAAPAPAEAAPAPAQSGQPESAADSSADSSGDWSTDSSDDSNGAAAAGQGVTPGSHRGSPGADGGQ